MDVCRWKVHVSPFYSDCSSTSPPPLRIVPMLKLVRRQLNDAQREIIDDSFEGTPGVRSHHDVPATVPWQSNPRSAPQSPGNEQERQTPSEAQSAELKEAHRLARMKKTAEARKHLLRVILERPGHKGHITVVTTLFFAIAPVFGRALADDSCLIPRSARSWGTCCARSTGTPSRGAEITHRTSALCTNLCVVRPIPTSFNCPTTTLSRSRQRQRLRSHATFKKCPRPLPPPPHRISCSPVASLCCASSN